jgi:hypothetical protein
LSNFWFGILGDVEGTFVGQPLGSIGSFSMPITEEAI